MNMFTFFLYYLFVFSCLFSNRISLSHMNPLSLSTTSSEKPGFLSRNVMEQMEQFLHTIIW